MAGTQWALAGSRHFARRALAPRAALQLPRLVPQCHLGSRGFAVGSVEGPPEATFWQRFVHWSYAKFSPHVYPKKCDICNCGCDLQIELPRPELVMKDDIERGTEEWRMQLYGAALYWHIATTPTENMKVRDEDFFRGKDILEVACFRGGGARYLAEVSGPKSYVATDFVQEHIDLCNSKPTPPNLRFDLANALSLGEKFEAESFDVVVSIQAVDSFGDTPRFMKEAARVLRPGGCLIIAEAFARHKFKLILDSSQEEGLQLDVCKDISRAVHAVGLCGVPKGFSYLHIVARKPDKQEWTYAEQDSAAQDAPAQDAPAHDSAAPDATAHDAAAQGAASQDSPGQEAPAQEQVSPFKTTSKKYKMQ